VLNGRGRESTHVIAIAIAITVTYTCSLNKAFHYTDDEYRTVFETANDCMVVSWYCGLVTREADADIVRH
jgi:hypothetical protein